MAVAQKVAAEEMDDTDSSGFDKIDSGKVEQTINQLNEALKGKKVDSKVKPKLNYAKNNWTANLKKYEEQEKINGEERASFSKTDTDATFIRA